MGITFFKQTTKYVVSCVLGVCLLLLHGCQEDTGNTSLLRLYITDAPIDADNVQSVNIIISDIAWKKGDDWESILYLEQPIGVDLLNYAGGKAFPLINQRVTAGKYSAFRLSLRMSNPNSSLNVNPLSSITLADNHESYLYWFEENEPTYIIIEGDIDIPLRENAFFVIDLDLRKSIRKSPSGEYIINPSTRLLNINNVGDIIATVKNLPTDSIVLAYAYRQGVFSDSELKGSGENIAFQNSVTSALVNEDNKFFLAFLEPGNYELIFVEHATATGSALRVIKRHDNVQVEAGEQTDIEVDIS